MLELIKQWLEKPSGRYFDGLVIFSTLAGAEIKKKYEAYFNQVKEEPKQHDIHFSMLINKVTAIAQAVQHNPKAFEGIELAFKITGPDAETQQQIEAKNAEIETLKEKIELLKSENSEVLAENLEFSDKVDELESDLETAQDEVSDYETKLEELEAELDVLKAKRGIQIIALADMPDDIRKAYDRNREITPLMAAIHSEIAVEKLHYKTREKLVKQLCDFDDERRANWDLIDDWSEGKTLATEFADQPKELPYDVDPIIAGAQMARRVLKLQENIKNSQNTVDTTDKETIKQNALKRIEAYTSELNDLTEKLKPAELASGTVE
jgi:predicted nuclease with TOPRIM domain